MPITPGRVSPHKTVYTLLSNDIIEITWELHQWFTIDQNDSENCVYAMPKIMRKSDRFTFGSVSFELEFPDRVPSSGPLAANPRFYDENQPGADAYKRTVHFEAQSIPMHTDEEPRGTPAALQSGDSTYTKLHIQAKTNQGHTPLTVSLKNLRITDIVPASSLTSDQDDKDVTTLYFTGS